MARPPIVVDPDVTVVRSEHVTDRYPALEAAEPDDAVAGLRAASSPTAFITSNTTWDDAYLDGLATGDWVTSVGSGYDSVPVAALDDAGVAFTNCPGVNAPQIGEHVFAAAFSFTRRLWTLREQQREHVWSRPFGGLTDLAGDVCTIVGIGNVGEAVAERAAAFDMTVRGVKRRVDDYDGVADAIYPPDALGQALADARLVVLSVPLTDETRHVIGAAELASAADDAILVNVARGPVLETDALRDALEAGRLRAACLDVTDPEPLPEGSPLWDRDDVLVTPHTAGLSEKYGSRFLERFGPQYDRWRQGEALRNRVV